MICVFYLALAVYPFEAVPIYLSDYRPLSEMVMVIAFIPIMVLYLAGRDKIPKASLKILGVLTLSVLWSLVQTWIRGLPFDGLKDFTFSVLVSSIMVVVISYCTRLLSLYTPDNTDFLRTISSAVTALAPLIVTYGCLEIIAINSELLRPLVDSISRLLTGGGLVGRVKLFTSEASWAAHNLIIFIPLIALSSRGKLYKAILLGGALLCFCLTFSFNGILTALLALLLTVLWVSRRQIISLRACRMLLGAAAMMAFLIIFGSLFGEVSAGKYMYDRLDRIKRTIRGDISVENLYSVDQSAFIRVNYPIIGLRIMADHPLGVGGGNYRYFWSQYLPQGVYWGPEVIYDYETFTADPKSLFAAIGAEFGFLALLAFILFQAAMLRKIDKLILGRKEKCLFTFAYFAMLCNLLQFGSYAYFPLWLFTTLVTNLR